MSGKLVDVVITAIAVTTPLAAYAALIRMFDLDYRMRCMEIKYIYERFEKEVKILKNLSDRREDSDSEDSDSEDE